MRSSSWTTFCADNLLVGSNVPRLWPCVKHCFETVSAWTARRKLFLLHSFKQHQPETNECFNIYLSQSWHTTSVRMKGLGPAGLMEKISSVSNGIHVAGWNMCSGCALIRQPSTSPCGSVYVVWLPGGEVVLCPI